MDMDMEKYASTAVNLTMEYAPKLALAIITLIIVVVD